MPVGKNSIKRATGGTAAKATFAVEEMAKAPVAAVETPAPKAPAKKAAAKKAPVKKVAVSKQENIHEKKFEAARAMFCALPDYLL